MTKMPNQNQLRPPPEHEHHRWHWIDTAHGPMPALWIPEEDGDEACWYANGACCTASHPKTKKWRYMGPAIPPDVVDQQIWVIAESGWIVAQGTNIGIRYNDERGWFQVTLNGKDVAGKWAYTLDCAKIAALRLLGERVAMGLDV